MEFSGKSAIRSAIRPFGTALLAAALSGCASPGPARPPSLHLPRLVTDLAAARTGNSVVLHWTTPEKTTDDLKIQPPLTAEICRELAAHPTVCTPVKRLAVHAGLSEASDTLPGVLAADPAALLTYRVQIFNAHGHSAGLSTPTFAAAGAAPPLVEDLRITPIRTGAMVEWQPQPTQAFIDLDRVLVQTTAQKKTSAKQSRQLSPSTPTEVHLQAGRQSADPGGTIDPTAQRGETYRYTAQRVRTVKLDGHALEIRSASSTANAVVMRDTFPPAMPTGLAAIASGTEVAHRSIDLSWEPDSDPDLAGYVIYRQTVGSDGNLTGAPTRLTPIPIPAPAFSDLTAVPGQTYSYRVTATDTAGNESPVSAEARESIRNQ